jgi:hypothetical protein
MRRRMSDAFFLTYTLFLCVEIEKRTILTIYIIRKRTY